MGIAIKKLESADIAAFESFLKSERGGLPELKLAPLVEPHEDIAVIAFKNKKISLEKFSEKYKFVVTEYPHDIVSLSRHVPVVSADHSQYIFSGYVFHDGKMLIGVNEAAENIDDIQKIREAYGEFCTCVIGDGTIKCSSDFFGMVPWFYFDNKQIFAVSNNYHLLLLLLAEAQVGLSMNIPRSRVNIITSGYTYGAVFSKDLDVNGCKINWAYEEINYSAYGGGYI